MSGLSDECDLLMFGDFSVFDWVLFVGTELAEDFCVMGFIDGELWVVELCCCFVGNFY